jgi:hypothetical protein
VSFSPVLWCLWSAFSALPRCIIRKNQWQARWIQWTYCSWGSQCWGGQIYTKLLSTPTLTTPGTVGPLNSSCLSLVLPYDASRQSTKYISRTSQYWRWHATCNTYSWGGHIYIQGLWTQHSSCKSLMMKTGTVSETLDINTTLTLLITWERLHCILLPWKLKIEYRNILIKRNCIRRLLLVIHIKMCPKTFNLWVMAEKILSYPIHLSFCHCFV